MGLKVKELATPQSRPQVEKITEARGQEAVTVAMVLKSVIHTTRHTVTDYKQKVGDGVTVVTIDPNAKFNDSGFTIYAICSQLGPLRPTLIW